MMGQGLQPDQPSGWEGEVPGAACVQTGNVTSFTLITCLLHRNVMLESNSTPLIVSLCSCSQLP